MPESDLNLLVALDALLAEGSVARAARRLGLSASAMSRTLARLREATGDPLLVRAGRGMVPTPHAQAIRERTRTALHDARAVLRPAGADLDLATLRRTLTIRANEGFVEAFGAQLLAALTAEAPHVMLCFAAKPEKTAAPLRDGTAELEIGVLAGMGPEVRVQALFRDRFVGVVRRGHPLQREAEAHAGDRIEAARYVAFGHVVATRKGDPRGPVDDALAKLGLARTVAAAVPGFPAALAVARHSDLIALVPASFFHAQGAESGGNGCFAFELPVDTGVITISQMWHPRLDADPVHRWLRRHVLAVCHSRMPP